MEMSGTGLSTGLDAHNTVSMYSIMVNHNKCFRFLRLHDRAVSIKALCFRAVCPLHLCVRPFVRTDLVTTISHEWLEHDRVYSTASTVDLIRFWRLEVKVTAGH